MRLTGPGTPPRPKRATRWKGEVVDPDGEVMWEVLVHDLPDPALRSALIVAGYRVRRATPPKTTGPLPLNFSEHDPEASIEAAREHTARRESQLGNALMLLIDQAGKWVPRSAIRRVAGDQGDRRVRELRARNWPIETKQLNDGEAWHVRLVIPPRSNGDTGQGTLL